MDHETNETNETNETTEDVSVTEDVSTTEGVVETGENVEPEVAIPQAVSAVGDDGEATHYPRFRIGARIEHFILMVTFTILAVTGLPQMFALDSPIARGMIDLMGGIETVRVVHRWAAFFLVIGSFYHVFTSAYRFFVKRERMQMALGLKDLTDLIDYVRYNLALSDKHPRMGKFNFGEKFEYWAVVWGTAVMTLTGFMLWNPIATTAVLPGEIIPIAVAAHGGEALLAVLAIII